MSLSSSPKLTKGGIVLIDPDSGQIKRIVRLQYNSETLSRTLQPSAVTGGQDTSLAMRLKGPPVETIKLDAELDATDQLEFPEQNAAAVEAGLLPQLAALETIVYPLASVLQANDALVGAGTLEIAPMEAPLTLFIWSKSRILPVRITDFSITEEAFDPSLNPIRAKVSLGLRVLSVDDLGFQHKGGSLFMNYLRAKEQLATRAPGATLTNLGVQQLP
ncbi:MAG TPA: hypothetical protein VGO61_03600 [Steroidobacteraceae bacterium]|nr:hypothetical protein [Steroidobacteraceae bacterium]